MLTKISRVDTVPVSARVASDVHPLPELGFRGPAGESGRADRGATADVAPVTSPLTVLRDHLRRIARGSGL